MAVEVERTYRVEAPIEAVWEVIADPATRASALRVVERFEARGDSMVWHLRLPIPLVRRTVEVRTRDIERDPPRFVRFVGESRIMDVDGEHELTSDNGETIVRNRFTVDGSLPGVERYFTHNIDGELDRIRDHVRATVAAGE